LALSVTSVTQVKSTALTKNETKQELTTALRSTSLIACYTSAKQLTKRLVSISLSSVRRISQAVDHNFCKICGTGVSCKFCSEWLHFGL